MRVGFVGLGIMGKPMAKNLINGKVNITVFDINQESVKQLAELGANQQQVCKI